MRPLTHSPRVPPLSRHLHVFHQLCSTPEAKIVCVREVFDFWRNNQQMIIILMDKLMTYRVVDNQAIINSIFADDMHQFFLR